MLNQCQFIGNLGGDPEIRYTQSGAAVANFQVAVAERWKNKQTGQNEERTEWVRCVAFNRLAEVCGEYLRKGGKVFVQGQLRTRKWQDQSGADRYTSEIILDKMEMLGGRGEEAAGSPPPDGTRSSAERAGDPPKQQTAPANPVLGNAFDEFEDDIPF